MPFLDFAEIKQRVSLEQAMQFLDLRLKRSGAQFRGCCPVHEGGDRTFVVTPDKGFFCFQSKQGGDVIACVAHVRNCSQREAAEMLASHFRITGTVPEGRKGTSSKEEYSPPQPRQERAGKAPQFDPDAFAAKLQYTPEVEALGLSQEDAERIGVGWHPQRKAIYLGFRNPHGSWSGWMKFSEGELVMPPSWISTNVVPMKRRAQQW